MNKAIPIVIVLAALGAAAWKYDVPAALGIARNADEELVLYGNIDIRQVSLAFRVNGRIEEAMVDEGDVIKRGDILARLDKDTYDHAVSSGEANVAALRATHEKLVAGPRQTEIAQARATRMTQAWRTSKRQVWPTTGRGDYGRKGPFPRPDWTRRLQRERWLQRVRI